jgi:hypothetical protein
MLTNLFSNKKREPAECLITISGEEMVRLYPYLTLVEVDTSRHEAAEARLTFESRRGEAGRWEVQDAPQLQTWAEVLVEAAFGDYKEEIMRGYIRQIDAGYPQDPGSTTVTLHCQDSSLALDREQRRRSWGADAPTTDRVIVQTIVADYQPMRLTADSASGSNSVIAHQDSTDIRFLQQRAEAVGYELLFWKDTVYFGPPRLGSMEPQPPICVYAGLNTNCIRFDMRDDGHLPDQVQFTVAATTGEQSVTETLTPSLPALGPQSTGSSGAGLRPFVWTLSREGLSQPDEARLRAQQLANENSLKVRAEGELDGSLYGHVLRVGEPVGVDGVGERYGGIYYVDEVKHRFDASGYRQTFVLLRNAYGDNLPSRSDPLAGVL